MRAAGVLLPLSSLPGPYGIGTLGEEAKRFVDFLAAAGQSYWQILPIGPTGYGDSPYQSFSAFAANPYFIDPACCLPTAFWKRERPRPLTGAAMRPPWTTARSTGAATPF